MRLPAFSMRVLLCRTALQNMRNPCFAKGHILEDLHNHKVWLCVSAGATGGIGGDGGSGSDLEIQVWDASYIRYLKYLSMNKCSGQYHLLHVP